MSGAHDHGHGDRRVAQKRVLWISLAANGGFMLVEIVGGLAFSSLALLADAAHMASDVGGLAIALLAQALVVRPGSTRHSFGLQRAEVLGALVNGILLVASSGWIVFEAIRRFGDEVEVEGGGLLVVAVLGLLVNLGSAVLLARHRKDNLNLRGAYLHMVADAAGSVAAIAAGVAVVAWGADWVDPAASLLIAGLVLWSAWGLLAATVQVLLEGTPEGLDPAAITAAITAQPGIDGLHHLHVWSIASDTRALSAHLVVDGEISMHEAQARGEQVRGMLDADFGITHATLELECHPCADPAEAHGAPGHPH
jgi:cobalt-zinc-cadmium efflux system protein